MFKRKRKIVMLMLVSLTMLATSIPGFAMKGKEGLASQQGIQELKEQFTYAPEIYYEDIDAMVKLMEDVHINLYHDISKEDFYKEIESLKASITTPISTDEFRKKVTVVVAKLKDGHTFVRRSQIFNELYYNDLGGLFPYGVDIVEDRFFVKASYASEKVLPLKAEILEINDVPVKTILDTHLEQQSGELDILKKAWLQGRFPFYYAAAMGFSEDFKVKYIPYGTDTPKSIVIEAVNYRDIEKDLDASFYREPYTYEYLEDLNAFYMKFDAFRDFKKFEGFSEEMFAEIEAKGSQDLIIDLRDNTGGYFDLGELLVSYLTDKPFRMN